MIPLSVVGRSVSLQGASAIQPKLSIITQRYGRYRRETKSHAPSHTAIVIPLEVATQHNPHLQPVEAQCLKETDRTGPHRRQDKDGQNRLPGQAPSAMLRSARVAPTGSTHHLAIHDRDAQSSTAPTQETIVLLSKTTFLL